MTADPPQVRPARAGERLAIERLVERTWGLPIVSRGRVCDLAAMTFVACVAGEELLGFATYELRDGDCELVTTNDNLDALGFYQRRGLRLVAVHPGAMDELRRLKPGVPPIGANGIPLRDELELELTLAS